MVKKIFPAIFSGLSLVLMVATWVVMSRMRPGDEERFVDLLFISFLCLLAGIYILVKKDP
ncbi:hypothetical protein A3C91_04295 [Candidatus Azambacteria bacterium RIFCSPHIGHO2_02_FULL_52_12]|uniref:Uncharacterized protein n=1 Tax=Candidatus Azambacteria bacterium RIFCSPLOWO2_01_FULL_46_25 TaxID=1797298 RepID=A0A1F5BUC9_9BACT|nr:MAG: hypothetical protein A3C91_04295 [Candidatus Azambacteria bacterium RIFCSPHIGHO2_02_FULL_52_12]OGD34197.1 MAG: hypothetical protein A2988_01845 [Candidatus Azambacteria bacterium RIFCSPLOWO2_01_FULL_46_25]OGD36873.1 MAG: hypothetical protein A2850_00925 [Candidatus Azambacteria bacterium RIFCSPHIGHO2_01_FULL_51_74]